MHLTAIIMLTFYISQLIHNLIKNFVIVILLVVVFFTRRIFLYKGGDFLHEGNDEYWIFKDTLSAILYTYPIIYCFGFLLIWFYYKKGDSGN
jgi:H+/Cl- antiporter ClcA